MLNIWCAKRTQPQWPNGIHVVSLFLIQAGNAVLGIDDAVIPHELQGDFAAAVRSGRLQDDGSVACSSAGASNASTLTMGAPGDAPTEGTSSEISPATTVRRAPISAENKKVVDNDSNDGKKEQKKKSSRWNALASKASAATKWRTDMLTMEGYIKEVETLETMAASSSDGLTPENVASFKAYSDMHRAFHSIFLFSREKSEKNWKMYRQSLSLRRVNNTLGLWRISRLCGHSHMCKACCLELKQRRPRRIWQ